MPLPSPYSAPALTATFWGVRGSLPVPGPSVVRYGGNTSCVSVSLPPTDGRPERHLVLDAGTGIRRLGRALAGHDAEIYLALTHLHNDHVQGFPFFDPLFERGRSLHLLDHHLGPIHGSLLDLFDGVHHPLLPAGIACDVERVRDEPEAFLAEQGFSVKRLVVNHPGGAYGYRIEPAGGGGAFVHIPDCELEQPDGPVSFDEMVEFCKGAAVLSHDAQYAYEEVPKRLGWGHSSARAACRLAAAAGVGELVLFHHDPDRDDEAVDELVARSRRLLAPEGIRVRGAAEGLRVAIPVLEPA